MTTTEDKITIPMSERRPGTRTVSMPIDGAKRLVDLLDRVNGCLRADPTGWTIDGSDRETLRAATEDLRRVVTARMARWPA